MELTEEQHIKWKDTIMGCLKEFIRICTENNLTYFCIGGTAIGALRHNGLIPWDDDIDVGMPRPDYDRFINICKGSDLGNYELATPELKGYPCHFAKLCDRRTTIIERKGVPCIYGLFLDIFPIDGTAPTKEEAVKLMLKYRRWGNKLDAVLTRPSLTEYLTLALKPREWGRMAVLTAGIIAGRERIRRLIIKKLDRLATTYSYGSTPFAVNYAGRYLDREIFPVAWSAEQCEHQFEDSTVKLPYNCDAYLTNVYGDYMKLPPVEKRVYWHDHAFVDINRRVSIEEARAAGYR